MKTIINFQTVKFLTFILLCTSLTACDDFVELEPKGETSENYFNNQEDYEDALIGAYDLLQATFWNVHTAIVASDDIIAGGDANNFDGPTLQRVDKMDHTPSDNSELRNIWTNMYAAMNRANYILEFQDKTVFEGKEEIIAQAYFLRAYFAFELTKWFGNIPLFTEERAEIQRIQNKRLRVGEQFDVNRVGSIAQIYTLIEEDLKEAIPNLSDTYLSGPTTTQLQNVDNTKYKITKGAAQALLGKVYLYHGKSDPTKFAKAATQLNKVINSGYYSLVDYTILFKNKEVTKEGEVITITSQGGENSAEAVFEVQYTSIEGGDWNCFNGGIYCYEGNYLPKNHAPRTEIAPYIKGWGFSLPTQALYDAYQTGDVRRDASIFKPTGDYEKSRENTGYFLKKHLPTEKNESTRAGSDPLNYENNYRAIRYADVLLMAAEAAEQSGGANAISYLNQVRARAFGDNTHDFPFGGESNLLEAIYKERRVELAGEGHRFFDLVRTGKAKEAFTAYNNSINNTDRTGAQVFIEITFEEGKNEIFPVPLVELELADAVNRWGQNPGY